MAASINNVSLQNTQNSNTLVVDSLAAEKDNKITRDMLEPCEAMERMRRSVTLNQILNKLNSKMALSIDLTKLRLKDINAKNMHAVLDALEKNQNIISISLSKNEMINTALTKRLLGFIFKITSLRSLNFYGIGLSILDIHNLNKLPLKELTLDECQVNDEMVSLFAQHQTLEKLILSGMPYSDISNQITSKALITVFRANKIKYFIFPYYTIIEKDDEAELIKTYVENTSITFMVHSSATSGILNNTLVNNQRAVHSKTHTKKESNEYLEYEMNFKGQKILMNYDGKLRETIDDIIESQSGSELKKSLGNFNFDPNCFDSGNDDNPFTNNFIANELYTEIWKIIKAFPGQINLTRKDMEGKTALIIAAKIAAPQKSDLQRASIANPSNLNNSDIKTNCDKNIESRKTADDVFLALLESKNNLDINAQDDRGCTALHYLAAHKKAYLFIQAIKAGACINIMDNQGRTPLDYCINLMLQEQRDIFHSIIINPDRDIVATQGNSLRCYTRCNFPSGPHWIANINTVDALTSEIQTDIWKRTYYAEFLAKKETIKGFFSGITLIEACTHSAMTNYMKKLIIECGALSFVRRLSEIESQIEVINQFQEKIQSLTGLGVLPGSIILQFSDMVQKQSIETDPQNLIRRMM